MTESDSQRIARELMDYVTNELLDGDARDLTADTQLLALGLIDSLSMVGLLAFIEERFGLRIPDGDVRPEIFASIASMARYLDGLGGAASALPPSVSEELVAGQRVWLTDGSAPPWLLLAPPGFPVDTWEAMLKVPAMPQRAIAPELRARNSGELASAAFDVLQSLNVGPAVVIGISRAAPAAVELARLHRDSVTALVIVGYGALDDHASWDQRHAELAASPPELLRRACHTPPARSTALVRSLETATDAAASFRAPHPVPWSDIDVPTLLVYGASDELMPADAVRGAAAAMNARAEPIASCGHYPHLERPDQLGVLITPFAQDACKEAA